MITKWFLGVSAKSKGYFTGFNNSSYRRASCSDAKPSFTKQTALAKSFNTKKDAENYLASLKAESKQLRHEFQKRADVYGKYLNTWDKLTLSERVKALCESEVTINYVSSQNRLRNWVSFSKINNNNTRWKPRTPEERDAVMSFDWGTKYRENKSQADSYENELSFLNDKIVIRQSEIAYKFKLNERKRIRWEERTADDTAYFYCNACGGAIPEIPQFVIGDSWSGVRICAICMGRLADDAKKKAQNVPEDILNQYATDRFLLE